MLNQFAKVAAIAVLAVGANAAAHAQSVKGSITLPSQAQGVAVNYLTNRVYVAVPGTGATDSLTIIDGNKDAVLKTISIPPIGHFVAVDVLTNVIYVAGCNTDDSGTQDCEVAVVNGNTNKVKTTIPVTTTPGSGIEGISVNPITGNLYVANASDNAIDVIRCGGSQVSAEISVAPSPFGVTVNPANNQVYAALTDGTVSVIDGTKNSVVTTTAVGGANAGIAVNWATGNVFVTNNNFGPSTVGVLGSKGNVLANVNVGNTPYGIDVDLGTNLAFVANTQDGTVSVINGKTNTVSATLSATGLYVAVNPVTEKVYVSGLSSVVTVLNEN
jgi:YVTN family beta-propeller protein